MHSSVLQCLVITKFFDFQYNDISGRYCWYKSIDGQLAGTKGQLAGTIANYPV
jgi:hypothetical protein